jgi:hypothetical protein
MARSLNDVRKTCPSGLIVSIVLGSPPRRHDTVTRGGDSQDAPLIDLGFRHTRRWIRHYRIHSLGVRVIACGDVMLPLNTVGGEAL